MGFGMVAMDFITLVLATLLYGGAALCAQYTYRATVSTLGTAAAGMLAAFTFLIMLMAEVAVMHRIFPRARPGRHTMMKGAAFWGWMLNFVLRRILYFGPLKMLFFTFNVLRYLSLRALGAKVAFTASMSSDVDILDPALLTVGARATLGARTLIAGHFIDGATLLLGEVTIGRDVLLGGEVVCGPRVRVGDGAKVLGRTVLSVACEIGAGATLQPECYVDIMGVVKPGELLPLRTHRHRHG